MDDFDQRVRQADGRNKIFQYRTRRIVFFFLVVGGVFTILDKCSSLFRDVHPNAVAPVSTDSIKREKSQIKPQTASSSHKIHSRKPGVLTPSTDGNTQSQTRYSGNTETPPIEKPKPTPSAPLQIAYSDNIEFKLISVIGSTKAQSVTITMVLITSAANWYIMSAVHSIIDDDGNEYKITSFKIGASNYFPAVNLVTGVPMRCTYTFGGVLPDVKSIKLFKYDYTHRAGEPFYVEFRDIPVDWK